MIDLSIGLDDQLSPLFKEFGSERNQSRIVNFTLSRIGRRYRAYLKSNFLGGQLINGGRGGESLSSRLRVYKDKRKKNVYVVGERYGDEGDGRRVKLANIYEHAGGYTIIPKRKKCLKFVVNGVEVFTKRVEGKERPFMSRSFAAFDWPGVTKSEGESVYKKEMEKALKQ
jgi:hypothetical protein